MYQITDHLIPLGHPNRPGAKLSEVRALVYHYTANYRRGANALANAKWFGRGYTIGEHGEVRELNGNDFYWGSAHLIVDDSTVVRALPLDEVARHVGSTWYTPMAHQMFKNENGVTLPNNYTIGIEMCVNEDGDWEKTVDLSMNVGVDIILEHNLQPHQVIRHYDVTGKFCPIMYIDELLWKEFKDELFRRVAIERHYRQEGSGMFKDVPDNHWSKEAIEFLGEKGIIVGDGSGKFRPRDNMTREEVAVLIHRLIQKANLKV